MADLSVIILTKNEAQHIERAVKSVQPICKQVFVIDSGSTDETCQIAEQLGCVVHFNPWTNYATQVNWALENCDIQTRWVMRLDADEYIVPELQTELKDKLDQIGDKVTSLHVPRRMHFMGRWVKHGGVGERLMLRIWVHGLGRAEERWMDEHTIVEHGETQNLHHPLVDDNLNSLTWWIEKHNRYASREAIDYLTTRAEPDKQDGEKTYPIVGGQAGRIRFMKEHIFYKLPPIVRGGVYFIFRYFFQLGFLDGISGTYYHFLQCWWYRTVVDAKIYEVRRYRDKHNADLATAIRKVLGFDI